MALCYDEGDEREYYEFEPLPTLLEDEENVSLADILSLRDSCLSEQDIWAACLECCLSMKSISHTPLFHTLCITPDTLAFNANGNVCFMEQLSDDPEGAFVPPEFDITGNTFEAHVYSLGATLAAAAEYVIEPELEPNLSQELRSLLDQMQQEKPEDRPDIEGILNTCEEKLKCLSSDVICRNLSAIGRRVLSIESVGAFQDGCEESCKEKKRQEGVGHELQTNERNPADGSSSTEDLPYDLNMLNNGTTEVMSKTEKCARDANPDSAADVDKTLQQGLEPMCSVDVCERREPVSTIDPAEPTVDMKNKMRESDRISPVSQKRSTARKRMLPKLPTEMSGSAQHLLRSKIELGRSVTPNLSPLSFSDIAAGSLSSLDSVNILTITDCPQKVPFRTKNNDLTFIPKCSLPSERVNVNNSSDWTQKVSSTEVVNKNLPNSCNFISNENREQPPKSPFALGKMSSTRSLKAKISATSFTPTGVHSQMDSYSSSGILLETRATAGDCSNTTPGAGENDYLSFTESHLSDTERIIGSHQRHYFKPCRSQSVNDLSTSNALPFRNVMQLCQDDNCEQTPPIRATENNPAEFIFDRQLDFSIPLQRREIWQGAKFSDLAAAGIWHEHPCISLEELLAEDDRPLKDHELWALCHECLISLQLCKDYPGNLDSFYLAPEFENQGVVTEKVCVYGVAAILWAAAKFNAPVNQKLPLSRNLKNLLLDMAKRNSRERPSITDALEICSDYLINRGIDSREILILLRNSIIQNYHKQGMDVIGLNCKTDKRGFSHSPLGNADFAQESSRTGFVPLASDSKLTAVRGPIPCQYSVNSKSPSKLPEAFTSPATHFKPIILTQHKEKTSVKMSGKNAKQLVKAMNQEKQGGVASEDVKSNVVVKAAAVNFESLESSTHSSASLVSSPFQTKSSSVSSVNPSTAAESKTNPPQTTSLPHQEVNCGSDSSAICNCPSSDHLHQNSKTGILTSPAAHLTVPEQALVLPSTSGYELNRHLPGPTILSEVHCGRSSENSLNSVRSQLQNTSNPTLDGCTDEKPNVKMYTLSESSNNSFKEFVDFDSVASVIPLSERCFFAQEILDTGNEIKPFAAVANITAEVSENVHLPSACISSCFHDNLMAIASSSPAPISLLQRAVHLIKEEFAFDGYLENGEEAHAMGEYILSLKSLKFSTFNNAISEKFYDLYWDDKLLEQLYEVANGNPPPPPSPLSKTATRPNSDYLNPMLQNTMKKKKTVPVHGKERSNDDTWEKAVDLEAGEISTKPQLSSSASSECMVLNVNYLSDNLCSVNPSVFMQDRISHNKRERAKTRVETPELRTLSPTRKPAAGKPAQQGRKVSAIELGFIERIGLCEVDNVKDCNGSEDPAGKTSQKIPATGFFRLGIKPAEYFLAKCKEDQLLSNVEVLLGQDTCHVVPDEIDLKKPKSGNCDDEEKVTKHFHQMEDKCNFAGEGCNLHHDLKLSHNNDEWKESIGQTTEVSESQVSEPLQQTESSMGKRRRNPGWSSAFFGIEYFNQQVKAFVKQLGQHNFSEEGKMETKLLELEQQLMMETKNFRKTKVFYQKLQLQEKRNKGIDAKAVLPKLKQQLEEMRLKVEFLELAKKYLEILQMEQWGLNMSVLLSLASLSCQSETLDLASTDSNSHLTFHTLKGDQNQSKNGTQVLQAGTAVGLMAYLFSSNAVIEGYVQQFFYTFRYFVSPCEFLQFLEDRFNSVTDISVNQKCSIDCIKVYNRSLDLLQAWIEECYSVDFEQDTAVLHKLETFISSKVIQHDSRGQYLINLLQSFSEENKSCKLPDFSFSLEDKVDEKGLFMLADYSPLYIAQQLTLLQQELFQDCHPIHFLNSRAFGVKDKPTSVLKSVLSESAMAEGSSLFVLECKQHQYLLDLIKYADNVSQWVSAEIVTCDTPKAQNSLLSKLLSIAKICYELRNFATAMQILSSLESLTVRQLPSWKNLSSKALEITEELTAVQVFLKSDSLCLMEGDSFRKQPTMPCARILAMHVQQLEIGAFTMANGTYKWPKLRKIAKVISQVRAFQEEPYLFTADPELQAHLRQRINNFSKADIHVLAAENKTNFYQSSTEWHSRKIQDALRKVKATFQ
ncbi:kinase non-catalytic C-lobe domain-containing protein 1 [Mustelus asterias]